ncbi:MAG: dihydrofolate reductase family protein [Planctomycetia bacterium]|nr:dihydrofolate reductase family protein [Planctomycetia bacterium]
MRPVIIGYMLSSVDGRIECSVLDELIGEKDYETCKEKLNGDAWLCGRRTMEFHFAEKEPFVSAMKCRVGRPSVYVANKADSYAIAVDTLGKLRWKTNTLDGDALICVVSEEVSEDYLETLREQGISYIVAGSGKIDLPQAMDWLGEHFGVRRLLLEGGGQINGGFLEAGLLDALGLLVAPGIDGRQGIPTLFDGLPAEKEKIASLRLKEVEALESGAVWLYYEVNR